MIGSMPGHSSIGTCGGEYGLSTQVDREDEKDGEYVCITCLVKEFRR
jgi:hypothetical protein